MATLFHDVEARLLLPGLTVGRLLDGALALFFVRLLLAMAAHPHMLLPRYGRTHRLTGSLLLLYLMLGLADVRLTPLLRLRGAYDIGLSLLGLATAFSAARDFGSARVHLRGSEASGILDEKATVSRSEMLEHCFYQLLNLCQVGFLYASAALPHSRAARTALAAALLLPWLARSRFPVNSFSANYKTPGVGGTTPLIRFLYRLKKWQYLLYKHFLLHGLNVSVAMGGGGGGGEITRRKR
mmetsp:Transcript_12206/g.39263  ORF Transcript_12206/g.39263 Transcript_12206/m.39263 type:complete len:240 (+) Transcript_12206:234-953(+)